MSEKENLTENKRLYQKCYMRLKGRFGEVDPQLLREEIQKEKELEEQAKFNRLRNRIIQDKKLEEMGLTPKQLEHYKAEQKTEENEPVRPEEDWLDIVAELARKKPTPPEPNLEGYGYSYGSADYDNPEEMEKLIQRTQMRKSRGIRIWQSDEPEM